MQKNEVPQNFWRSLSSQFKRLVAQDKLEKVVPVSKQAPMDTSFPDGTLSSSNFCLAARAFVEKWRSINSAIPPWSWVRCPKSTWFLSHEVEGYLSLENMCFLRCTEDNHDEVSHTREEESSCFLNEDSIDTALLVQRYNHEVHYYDFHIVYCTSYRVPVLYFRAYCSDGQPLILDDIERDLPAKSAKVLLESKWAFITQEEHPYLNRPWYKLHPCGTSEWMKLLSHSDASLGRNGAAIELYLVSWLSVVGQVVGLQIPLEMLKKSCQL